MVNKLNTISNKFRVFDMELLAGEPDYLVEHVRFRLAVRDRFC